MEAISSYFLQTAIAQPWARFETRLLELEQSLDVPISSAEPSIASLQELRAAHNATLDAILFGLLLRRRQTAVMQLLEEIFTLILKFSGLRQQRRSSSVTRSGETQELYDTFRAKVATFVAVCQGLSGKTRYAKGPNTNGSQHPDMEGVGIEGLILRLDMNRWWSQ
jgi:hypothetical protein